jgi:hypothetical protein
MDAYHCNCKHLNALQCDLDDIDDGENNEENSHHHCHCSPAPMLDRVENLSLACFVPHGIFLKLGVDRPLAPKQLFFGVEEPPQLS